MENKLKIAIQNNNDLYEAVFSQWDIPFQSNDEIWYSFEEVPPLYSNLVTRSPEWRPDATFTKIDNASSARQQDWSIKDSFAVLDLSEHGFAKLFEAKWIHLQLSDFRPLSITHPLIYKILANEEELSTWRLAWDVDEQIGINIFSPRLLNNPRVKFIAGYRKEKLICGCMVNESNSILGISNFYSPARELTYWSDMLGFIFGCFDNKEIVGYERYDLVNQLETIGFRSLGNLAVWIKTRNL
jgi:hypothetical protein